MKKQILISLILLSSILTMNAQSNSYPTTGSIKVFDYSPLVILQRNSSEGGFVQGIQTKSQDGTDNWYFGNLMTDTWMVSKGNWQNPKMTILDNGNVGIGTTTPISKFTIGGNLSSSTSQLSIINNEGGHSIIRTGIAGITNQGISFLTANLDGSGQNNVMVISADNNVGIGTTTPTGKLDIMGPYAEVSLNANASASVNFRTGGHVQMAINTSVIYPYTTSLQSKHASADGSSFPIALNPLGGNVGIGTTNPTNKLDVNGTIHTKEVKVDMIGWPDFVFKKEYSLPTLEEVEKQITEKGHLANIPSEQEVLKNGINVGEMNAKLLQKIEELTLYVIEQNKRIEKLEMSKK